MTFERFNAIILCTILLSVGDIMRIITGTARGKRLITPEGNDIVRPTPERVKEGLFSAIQFDLAGRRILDLFAGSGQLGLEALSRGAESAVFVDNSDISLSALRENLKCTGFENARVVKSDYSAFTAVCDQQFDIAFLDPPYAAGLFEKAIAACAPLMSSFGIIICEHPESAELPERISGFSASRQYRYGKVCVTVFRREEAVV